MARKPSGQSPVDKAKKVWAQKPADYLSGGTAVGDTYNAWDTYKQGKPDFGKGAGPGEPYHQVQKKISPNRKKPPANNPPNLGTIVPGAGNSTLPYGPPGTRIPSTSDPRTDAIRRRLRGL